MKRLSAVLAAGLLLAGAGSAQADLMITINPNLSVTLGGSGFDDVLVNVQNNSAFSIKQLHLVSPGGNNLFQFDSDGPFGGGYTGPNASFGPINSNSNGFVNFTIPLPPGFNGNPFGLESEFQTLPGDLQVTVTDVVPEPATLAIFAVAGLSGAFYARRRKVA